MIIIYELKKKVIRLIYNNRDLIKEKGYSVKDTKDGVEITEI